MSASPHSEYPAKEAEGLSEILGHVYDAALDPDLWPAAIGKACGYLACGCGAIGRFDVLHLDSTVVSAWGYEQPYLDRLTDSFKQTGLVRDAVGMRLCEVAAISDVTSLEAYYKSEPYLQWAQPQGIVDSMQAMLERTPTTAVAIGFARFAEHGPVDEQAKRRLTLLAPHMRRSVLIGKTLDLKRVEAAAFADTIDGLAAGVFLVDARSRLIHANASGEAMLARDDFLRLAGGALTAADPKADRALRVVVAAIAQGDAALPAGGSAIAFGARTGERFSANVLPLTSGRRRQAGTEYAAAAAIFVGTTEPKFPQAVKTIAALHKLTAGEMRVLSLILEVQGISATATMLGLSETTVKTHLRSIFRKTGTHSQADLVKLAAGHASPLART